VHSDFSRRDDRDKEVRKSEVRGMQSLLRDRQVGPEFPMDRGAVEVVRFDRLGATIGLDPGKEEVPAPAANGTLDPERLGVRAYGHGALFALERKRYGNVRRLRPFPRLGGRFLARQDLSPGDQACIAAISRTELERGHNPARHEFMRKIAMVGFSEVRMSALTQDRDPLVVKLVDQATMIRGDVVLLLLGPVDVQIRLPRKNIDVVRKALEAATYERMEVVKWKVPVSSKELKYFDVAIGDPGDPRPSPAIKRGLTVPAGVARWYIACGIHAALNSGTLLGL